MGMKPLYRQTPGRRTLYLESEFYQKLTKTPTGVPLEKKDKINYFAVKKWTDEYDDQADFALHSVFKRFDRLVFVIPPLKGQADNFMLIMVHFGDKKISVINPVPDYDRDA